MLRTLAFNDWNRLSNARRVGNGLWRDAGRRERALISRRRVTRSCIDLLLALSLQVPAEGLAASFAPYMRCAKAIGVAIHETFTVVPTEKRADRGLYLYEGDDVFFLPLGSRTVAVGGVGEYWLRTRIPDVGELFLEFREVRPAGEDYLVPAISYRFAVSSANELLQYRLTPLLRADEDEARDALRKALSKKIAGIKYFIDEKNKFSSPAEATAAFKSDRTNYLSKLDECRIEDDYELNRVVAEEVEKLQTEFRGATIWEKQVGKPRR